MNSKENSTGAPGSAIAIQDMIDGREGILAQALRVKNLSRLLMGDIEFGFDFKRARTIDGDALTFIFRRDNIDTTLWTMSELWTAAHEIASQIDVLSNRVNTIVEADGK